MAIDGWHRPHFFAEHVGRKGLRKVRGLLYGPPPMRRLLAFFLLLWTQFNVCLSSAVGGGVAWAAPPRVLPVSSPLCESALVPCLEIDGLAFQGHLNVGYVPREREVPSGLVLGYGGTIGLFGRVSGSFGTDTGFRFLKEGTAQTQGPLRATGTVLLYPFWPLARKGNAAGSRVALQVEYFHRTEWFSGENLLGIAGNLWTVRGIHERNFGRFMVRTSLAAHIDGGRKYAVFETGVMAQAKVVAGLRLHVAAMQRGVPAFGNGAAMLTVENALPVHGALSFGASYRVANRVDAGLEGVVGFGLDRFQLNVNVVSVSIGRGYDGQMASGVTGVIADAAKEVAEHTYEFLKELFREVEQDLAIDPRLDENCVIRDDDGKPMGVFGVRSKTANACEVDGVLVPIGKMLYRDKGSTRLCYETERVGTGVSARDILKRCTLFREGNVWKGVHPVRLDGACDLRDWEGRVVSRIGTPTGRGTCAYEVNGASGKRMEERAIGDD